MKKKLLKLSAKKHYKDTGSSTPTTPSYQLLLKEEQQKSFSFTNKQSGKPGKRHYFSSKDLSNGAEDEEPSRFKLKLINSNYIKLEQTFLEKNQMLVQTVVNTSNKMNQFKLKQRNEETAYLKSLKLPESPESKLKRMPKFRRNPSPNIQRQPPASKNPEKSASCLQLTQVTMLQPDLQNKLKQFQTDIKELRLQNAQLQSRNTELQSRLAQIQANLQTEFMTENAGYPDFKDDQQIDQIFLEVQQKLGHSELENSTSPCEVITENQLLDSISDLQSLIQKKSCENSEMSQIIGQMLTKQHCQQMKHQEELKALDRRWATKWKRLNGQYEQLKLKMENSFVLNLESDRSLFDLSVSEAIKQP